MAGNVSIRSEMTSASVKNSGFVPLGNGIYIKKPSDGAAKLSGAKFSVAPPSLIFIFSWMGAAMPHILKYTNMYDGIYPSATQILVRTEPSFFWTSFSSNKAKLAPLLEALQAMEYLPAISGKSSKNFFPDATTPGILVHSFSNGGATHLNIVHEIFASRQSSASDAFLPVRSAVIFDSNPGKGTLADTKRAFAASLRNPLLRLLMLGVIHTFFALGYLMGQVSNGVFDFFINMRVALNSESLLGGWLGLHTPRLYLYSDEDDLVPSSEVEEHANEAKAKGFDVKMEKFSGSKHVSHARVHPDQYWAAVKDLWERAMPISN